MRHRDLARETAIVARDVVLLRRALKADTERLGLDALVATLAARRARRVIPGRVLALGVRVGEAIANRVFPDTSTCLYRALARFAVLRQRGIDARFALGVRSDDPKGGTGHAWVEDEAGPWGEEIDDGEYVVTFSWP